MAAAVERRGEQPRGASPGGRPLQRRTEAAVLRARRLHDRAAPVRPRHLARLFLAVLLNRRDSPRLGGARRVRRSEEHTSELQSHSDLVCRLLLEKKKKQKIDLMHET